MITISQGEKSYGQLWKLYRWCFTWETNYL